MQDQAHMSLPASVGPNAAPGTSNSMPVENAIGTAFIRMLADTQGHAQRNLSSRNNAIQSFVKDVRRRRAQPHGTYDDLVDIAAIAGLWCRLLRRKSQRSRLIDHLPEDAMACEECFVRGNVRLCLTPPQGLHMLTYDSPPTDQQLSKTEISSDDDDPNEFEAIERQELLNEAYDSGYSIGFEAGIRAGAAQDRQRSTEMSYAEGFAAGQRAELDRGRTYVAEVSGRTGHDIVIPELVRKPTPHWSQPPRQVEPAPSAPVPALPGYPRWDSLSPRRNTPPVRLDPTEELSKGTILSSSIGLSHGISSGTAEPSQLGSALKAPITVRPEARPRHGSDSRHMVVTCVFCGQEVTANSLLRHKKRRHPAELAAVGVELQYYPCWWPDCGMLQDNLVPNQLTTHLQRKHNFAHPGDSNAFTENVKYYNRMFKNLVVSIISESAQELNAVKERIKSLEAQLRTQNPSYVSRHGLPNLNHLHETRARVIDLLLLEKALPPLAVQELRQLKRARGMRSQIRHDEGTWWEVADDLEAALNPSGALAQAVAALPPPGDVPTVHMNVGTLVEGPNMNDPSWKPRYAPLFQPNWRESTSKEEDLDGVILPPNTAIRRTNFEIVIPSFFRPAPTAQDQVEDEQEKEGFQRLMAEIEQRVVDDDSQPDDWNNMNCDEIDEIDEDEGDETRYDAVPYTRPSSQQQKRPGPTISMPGRKKRRKSAQVKGRKDADLG